jgi:hypothetical protein
MHVQGSSPARLATAGAVPDQQASRDTDADADAPPARAGGDDLDALLASLGSDDSPEADTDTAKSDDDGMDVDLDELLKSLG